MNPLRSSPSGWSSSQISPKNKKGVPYTEIDVTSGRERELEMIERSGARNVPQIFIDDQR